MWPSLPFLDQVEILHQEHRPPYDFGLPTPLPDQARVFLSQWQTRSDLEAIYKVKEPCTIDPKMGIVFSNKKVLWGSSDLPYRERNPKFLSHLKKPDRYLEKAISLHHVHGDNYFHFFMFVVCKVMACRTFGLPDSIPFLVNEQTANTPFFKQAISLGLFGNHEIVVQPRKKVFGVEECYLVRTFAVHAPYFDQICEAMGLEEDPADGPPILLVRDETAPNGRTYRNQAELSNFAKDRGFQVFDPGQLPIIDQARIFNRSPLIISPHGAGLTNIIFRRKKPSHLIELFNPGMGSGHYYLIAMEKGFHYASQMTINPVGTSFTANTEVDLSALKAKIDPLMDQL